MASVAQSLTGRKWYTRGSYAPTRGRVNPQGYIQRELRNRNMRPQRQSQSRSGLAQRALRRQNAQYNRLQQRDQAGRDRTRNQLNEPAQPEWTPPNYVNINSNGQLDLPYNENFGWDLLQQKERMNSELQDLTQQDQQQRMEFNDASRQAGMDFTNLNRDTLNHFAGRGMAFSSGYGGAVGENATQYNNFMNSLNQRRSLFDASLASRRSGIETSFNDYLRQAALQQAQGLSGQAGHLGYGQSQIGNSYGNPGDLVNAIPGIKRPKPPAKPRPVRRRPTGGRTIATGNPGNKFQIHFTRRK